MTETVEPYTFSQFMIDTYYENRKRRDFIYAAQIRYPNLEPSIIEGIWHILDFMAKAIK